MALLIYQEGYKRPIAMKGNMEYLKGKMAQLNLLEDCACIELENFFNQKVIFMKRDVSENWESVTEIDDSEIERDRNSKYKWHEPLYRYW